MKLEEVKRNLQKKVNYKGDCENYTLTACVLRKHKKGYFYYSVELTDGKTNNSIVICRLKDITSIT